MRTPRPTLTQLAHHAAAQIGFTVRRWRRDATDPSVLHVEVERRLVGVRPAVAELIVSIPPSDTPPRTRSAIAPPPTPARVSPRMKHPPPPSRPTRHVTKAYRRV